MRPDSVFWEDVAIPVSRMVLQVTLTRPEIFQAIASKNRVPTEFAAEMGAALADSLLYERNRRIEGHPSFSRDEVGDD